MDRRGYPLTVLHEYAMTPKSIRKTIDWLGDQDLKKLRDAPASRPSGSRWCRWRRWCCASLLHVFRPKMIYVSSYGIREGILFEQMPDALRSRDPLIEACRFYETANARLPGFGKKLFEFLKPLYRNASEERLRLIKAACLLHDVNWRAHPDYRAESCFDTATRANLGGLDHKGRVYLGLALMNRYKNAGTDSRLTPLLTLLDEDEIRHAIMLGRAMRFGAMLSIGGPEGRRASCASIRRRRCWNWCCGPSCATSSARWRSSRFHALAKTLGVEPAAAHRARLQSSKGSVTGGSTSSGGSGVFGADRRAPRHERLGGRLSAPADQDVAIGQDLGRVPAAQIAQPCRPARRGRAPAGPSGGRAAPPAAPGPWVPRASRPRRWRARAGEGEDERGEQACGTSGGTSSSVIWEAPRGEVKRRGAPAPPPRPVQRLQPRLGHAHGLLGHAAGAQRVGMAVAHHPPEGAPRLVEPAVGGQFQHLERVRLGAGHDARLERAEAGLGQPEDARDLVQERLLGGVEIAVGDGDVEQPLEQVAAAPGRAAGTSRRSCAHRRRSPPRPAAPG
jgi:hypothetical protein